MLAAALLVEMAILLSYSFGRKIQGRHVIHYMHDIDDNCTETNKMQWQVTWIWAFKLSCHRQQDAGGMLFIPWFLSIYQRGDDTIFA